MTALAISLLSTAYATDICTIQDLGPQFTTNPVSILGHDCAYSIALPDARTFWVFGDTFVGTKEETSRTVTSFPGNTGAILSDDDLFDGISEFRYIADSAGTAVAFLKNEPGEPEMYRPWPMHGIARNTKDNKCEIVQFYTHAEIFEEPEPPGNIKHLGSGIAIGMYEKGDLPKDFVRVQKDGGGSLWSADEPTFGTSVIYGPDDFVYVYITGKNGEKSGTFVARMSDDDITSPTRYRFFAGDGKWVDQLREAVPLFTGAPCEHSVSYNHHLGCYVAVHMNMIFPEVCMRFAPRPEGPWSEAEVILRPEPVFPDKKRTFYYAAKEHAPFAREGGRVVYVTYIDSNEYWPRLLEVTLDRNAIARKGLIDQTPLRTLAEKRNLLIGAAVGPGQIRNEQEYGETLAREFNVLTTENHLKFGPLRPSRDKFDFSGADTIVEFAEKNNMIIRGHTLVWHDMTSSWLTNGNFSTTESEQILREHILTTVGRYKGRIRYWDVVNEAIADDCTSRPSYWYDKLGAGYVEKAFRWAHEADPEAKLFYNDYGAEGMNEKSNAVFRLVKQLKRAGVPIHGVGLQFHIDTFRYPKTPAIIQNVRRLAELGLEVHVTELDVKTKNIDGTMEQRLRRQAKVYDDVLRAYIDSGHATCFITWGFSDKHSWIRDELGLPFDRMYGRKPASEAMKLVMTGLN